MFQINQMFERDLLAIGIKPAINQEFRKLIGLKYGYGRKNLRLAVEDALTDWIEKTKRENGL